MNENKNISRKLINILVIFVLAPLTLFLSWKVGAKKYYLTSVLLIIYTMIPFFLSFEKRKPQARELVVLAVMTAIAVASRAAFIMLPHFKPMTAIIIITAVSFGAEAGFLTGAMSAFISNFIFGQGPWTPWQMFAYGIAGFLSGLLFSKGIIKKDKIPLSIFGGIVVVFLVGPMLDISSVFTASSVFSFEIFAAAFVAGFPVNLVHTAATAITLFLFSQPMFEKLDRIKLKYGMK
ncbi:MAG: ECF transporter S component [Anaerofustis stercorihominis]|nr:ECF transporter S component [Anaerofustis stercorihominis]